MHAATKPELDNTQEAHNRRLRWSQCLAEMRTQEAQAAAKSSEARLQAASKRLAELENELQTLRHHLHGREDKIRRMQSSGSWLATAPFRALRRFLVDRLRDKSNPGKLPTPSAPAWAVDLPMRWDAAPAVGVLSGWAFWPASRRLPFALRALIDGKEVPATLGLPRQDVLNAFKLSDTSMLGSGFRLSYKLEPDLDYEVRLEAREEHSGWCEFHRALLHTSSQPIQVRDYEAWVEKFGRCTPEKAATLRQRLQALPSSARPLLSVLMPVYNSPGKWLTRAIESVREQVYENWELCIADDASTAPHMRPLLEKFQALDPRIRVVFRQTNGHISRASNSALELARGDFTALLDHDDELAPDALAQVVLTLAEHPATDLLYSDEDKIDEEGRRFVPYFKPDYMPELLTGQNCFSHLSVLRSSLMREIGGFRPDYEGSQDWDLCLRAVERSQPSRIRHIPRILYHWRAISGSTAVDVGEKSYSTDAARRALLDHFARKGEQVEVVPVPGSHWRIVHPRPSPAPLVSLIIPTHNGERLLRRCIASLCALTEYPNYELLIVDNRSDDPGTLAFLAQLRSEPRVRVLNDQSPFNFSALNNRAVREARGELVCLLNNDIEIIDGQWLDELVSQALRPEIGAVGAMLYYPDQSIQHAGIVLGLGGVANHAFMREPRGASGQMNRARLANNYSAVTAACLVIRKATYDLVGGFNEKDLAVAFNDVDFCLRVRKAGFRNLWTPRAELLHHESASRGYENTPEKQARFEAEVAYMRRTWGEQLDSDPAYNPNLALSYEGWDLAWPPRA